MGVKPPPPPPPPPPSPINNQWRMALNPELVEAIDEYAAFMGFNENETMQLVRDLPSLRLKPRIVQYA